VYAAWAHHSYAAPAAASVPMTDGGCRSRQAGPVIRGRAEREAPAGARGRAAGGPAV